MNKALRRTSFKGCTGLVKIEPGSNDRLPGGYKIQNGRLYDNGTFEIVEVGLYNPLGLVLFNFTVPVIWPDNTTNVPADIRTSDIDCPFESKQVVTFVPGRVTSYMSLTVLCLLSVSITLFIWRKWWNLQAEPLTSKAEISFEDYMLFASIGIEAFQYINLGPSLPKWVGIIKTISNSARVNLESFINLKNGVYWSVLHAIFGAVGAWLLFCVTIAANLDAKVRCLFPKIRDLGEKLLPLLGNVCFLPIISLLMDVFNCPEAADTGNGVDFTTTFLQQDCYQHCWVSPHIYYVVGAVVSLLLYLPLAVYLRPTWQDRQLYLHINTAPAYLMVKTIYQVSIIVMNKTIGEVFAILHSFLFLATTLAFFMFTVWRRPYGYSRANLWHYVSLVCVLWLSLLSTIEPLTPNASVVMWVSLLFIGAGLICIAGLIWQIWKLPSLLYTLKGIHVVDLFKFMLSRGNKYSEIFSNMLNRAEERNERLRNEFIVVKLPTVVRLRNETMAKMVESRTD